MYRHGFHSHTAPGMSITATAKSSGIAQGYLGPVPAGYCWYVERETVWSNTSQTTATLEVFVVADQALNGYTATAGDRTGRQDVSLAVQNQAADNSSPIYVPETYFLVALWTGLTSGDLVTLSTQVAVHQLNLEYGESRRDISAMHTYLHEQDAERAAAPAPHN